MFICIIRGIVLAINIVYHDTLYTLDLKVSIALNSYCANGSVETAPDWSKITLVIEGFKYGLSLSTFVQNIYKVHRWVILDNGDGIDSGINHR